MKWFSLLLSAVIVCQSRGNGDENRDDVNVATKGSAHNRAEKTAPPQEAKVSQRFFSGSSDLEEFPRRPYDTRYEEIESRFYECTSKEIALTTKYLVNVAYEATRPVCLYTKALVPQEYPLISAACNLNRKEFYWHWLTNSHGYIQVFNGDNLKPEEKIKAYVKLLKSLDFEKNAKLPNSLRNKIVCNIYHSSGRILVEE